MPTTNTSSATLALTVRRPLLTIARAGIGDGLGLTRLMSRRARLRHRARLVEVALEAPTASTVTFAGFYLLAALVSMLATALLGLAVVFLFGAWSQEAFAVTNFALIGGRALLGLRPLLDA